MLITCITIDKGKGGVITSKRKNGSRGWSQTTDDVFAADILHHTVGAGKGGIWKGERESWGEMEKKALSNDFRGHSRKGEKKSVHSSLLSWALANDNNLSSSLFLDNEPQ